MKKNIYTLFFFLLVTQICFGQPVSPSTSQGGWYQQNSVTTKNLYDVEFTDANNGFAVGDGGIILRTSDAGINWEIQPSGTSLPLNDIFFLDENNGWIAGGYANTGQVFWTKEIVLKTDDGGSSWYKQFEDSADCPSSIFFNDTLNGWCVGYKIRRTTNGGINWSEVIGLTWEVWSDVYFKNLDTGMVAGTRFGEGRGAWPATIRTMDGWNSFILEDLPSLPLMGGGLSGICATGINCVFVVGSMGGLGLVGKTTDWGINWTTEIIEGPSFNDIYFVDETNGWVAGGRYGGPNGQNPVSIIRRTTDSGVSWVFQMNDTLNVFNGVFFTDVLKGWVVGDRGAIFRTTNGGVSFIEEEQIDEVPTKFLLSQNYPNPFNPQTSIQYAINSRQFVSLKVYDVLGNEIETLVSEEKPAGTYEIEFNSHSGEVRNLPSGVYFYQLKAGDYVNTKKMILLK